MFDLDALAELDRGLNALVPFAVRAAVPPQPRDMQAPAVCPETSAREGRCPFFHGGTA
jgi:hypothetical protein